MNLKFFTLSRHFTNFATKYISLFLFFFQIYLHQLIGLTSNKMTVDLEFIWVNLVSFFTEEYVPSMEEQQGQSRRNRGCRGPFPLHRFCLKKKQNDLCISKGLELSVHNNSKVSLQIFYMQKQNINQEHPDLSKWPVKTQNFHHVKAKNIWFL